MKIHSFLIGSMLCSLTVVSESKAGEPLPPGTSVTVIGRDESGGSILTDDLYDFEVRNSSEAVILTGRVQNRSLKSSSDGTFSVLPRVRDLVAENGTARVVGMELQGLAGFDVEVSYSLAGGDIVLPDLLSRSEGDGDVVTFSYASQPLEASIDSQWIRLWTAAKGLDRKGELTIHVEESPGGDVYSATVEGMARTVDVPDAVRILSLVSTDFNRYELTFENQGWRFYDLLWSNDGTNWVQQTQHYVFTTPHTVTVLPFGGGNPSQQFYQVRSVP